MSIHLDSAQVLPPSPLPGPALRSSVHTLMGVQVLAVDSYVPDEVVDNASLAARGFDDQWIVQRTGIRQRRRAPREMAASDLAFEAARRCLDKASVDPSEVDLILVATVTPDTHLPATACHLQSLLGCQCPAMDVNAACSGFVYALATAAQFVKTGFSRAALVVGADLMTRIVDPDDKKTYPLFGDGAGAALIGPGGADQGLLAYTLGADGEGAELLYVPAGGTREPASLEAIEQGRQYMQMAGRPVFKWAVRTVADTIREVVAAASLTLNDISLFVLHQANLRILDAVASDLGIGRERLLINVDRYGNTSAASIPLALAEADELQRIRRGDRILLCGFGAGLTWGTAVLQW